MDSEYGLRRTKEKAWTKLTKLENTLGARWKPAPRTKSASGEAHYETNKKVYENKVEAWKHKNPKTPVKVPAGKVEKWTMVTEPKGRKCTSIADEGHGEEEENLEQDIGTGCEGQRQGEGEGESRIAGAGACG